MKHFNQAVHTNFLALLLLAGLLGRYNSNLTFKQLVIHF
jgi:hypothetical protein